MSVTVTSQVTLLLLFIQYYKMSTEKIAPNGIERKLKAENAMMSSVPAVIRTLSLAQKFTQMC